MPRRLRRALPALIVTAALALTACGPTASTSSDDALVVYNAQHERLTEEWADAFTEETGIDVVLRNGGDSELGNQLVSEGDASAADVFLTENSPAMSLVENAGLLAPVEDETLEKVPADFRPTSGDWIGIAARSTVLVYNPSMIDEADLPASLMDLQKPEWKGRWGAAPSGADFQAIVSAVLQTQGSEATMQWLDAMDANAEIYTNNIATMKAVNAGEVPVGVIYHYYWYRDQDATKENSANTKLHYFGRQDPGAFVSISGGAVLKNAKHPEQAQKFLAFLAGTTGQKILGDGYSFEYPVASGAAANPALPALDTLDAPRIDPSTLNGRDVIQLMINAGLL